MEDRNKNYIYFYDDLSAFNITANMNMLVHILCVEGSFSFTGNRVRFNVASGDYVIFTPGMVVSDVLFSEDVRVVIMVFPQSVVLSSAIRSNYGVFGHIALIENPVMKLSQRDFARCHRDMAYIRERVSETSHIFYDELIGALLKAHILDLYDIHARSSRLPELNSQPARLMQSFVEMLVKGDYIGSRKLERYASALCITPHYLTEISNRISGRPATYWIELFLIRAVVVALIRVEVPLEVIADDLSFSSLSHFSRFVKSKLGMTPTSFRNQFRR